MGAVKRKLLIIDDDTIVRESVAAYLEDSGYDVREAGSGPQGLQLFHEFQPELVLSDLKMPDMGGMSVLREIHSASPDTPVIVISGVGVMDDVVEALRLGASDYLIKPIGDMEVLEHAIRQGLKHNDLIAENRLYREQLEQSNLELRRNLQIFERDQKAGRQVQERLLPPSPLTRRGYTISRNVFPSLYLSGDCIDYGYFVNRYLAFYLTDVSGHGAASAFVTIWLKFLVRQLIRDRELFGVSGDEFAFADGPNVLLQGVNRELIATRLNNHLTSFHGTIDCKTHKMRYAVGGHLPMPILVTDNGAIYLDGKGKPLGIFHDIEWEVLEIDLPETFAMVIFSDGILETLPAGSLEEKEAMLLRKVEAEVGAATRRGDTMKLESICQSLGLEQKADNPDDIAVLLVTRGY